jgi:phage portal protein BeeE
VPPHKVAILERSTNNNIEHQGIEYVTDCLLTWCRRWEERLAQDLLTEERARRVLLRVRPRRAHARRHEVAVSRPTRAAVAGWLTRNEVRRRENLDPLPTSTSRSSR